MASHAFYETAIHATRVVCRPLCRKTLGYTTCTAGLQPADTDNDLVLMPAGIDTSATICAHNHSSALQRLAHSFLRLRSSVRKAGMVPLMKLCCRSLCRVPAACASLHRVAAPWLCFHADILVVVSGALI